MNIPDEAVEAAALILHTYGGLSVPEARERAQITLEAAAPHMLREALLVAADALGNQPPQLKHQTVATLRLYAAEPWRINNAGTCPSECAASHPGREHPDPDGSRA